MVSSPILLAALIAVRLESRGSPIYRQLRVGKDGRPFEMLKLRTMVSGAERIGAGLAVNQGDARITRTGALLRRFSLDELPNLVNVLRGEMAVVGPRPTCAWRRPASTTRTTCPSSSAWSRSTTSAPWCR